MDAIRNIYFAQCVTPKRYGNASTFGLDFFFFFFLVSGVDVACQRDSTKQKCGE